MPYPHANELKISPLCGLFVFIDILGITIYYHLFSYVTAKTSSYALFILQSTLSRIKISKKHLLFLQSTPKALTQNPDIPECYQQKTTSSKKHLKYTLQNQCYSKKHLQYTLKALKSSLDIPKCTQEQSKALESSPNYLLNRISIVLFPAFWYISSYLSTKNIMV